MNPVTFTTLSTQELQELIVSSIKRVIGNNNPIKEDDDILLDCKEAALLLKYEVTSIYGLVKRKKIPFCKVEGKLLFSKKQLLEWVAKNTSAVTKK